MLSLKLSIVDTAQARREQVVLQESGILPPATLPVAPASDTRWCGVYVGDSLVGGAFLSISRSRRVPWAHLVRWERVGGTMLDALLPFLPEMLDHLGQLVPSVLRVSVAAYETDQSRRTALEGALHAADYAPTSPRSYLDTLWLDLNRPIEALLAGCSSSTRRNLREARNAGIVVKEIRQPELFEEAFAVMAEAFQRRGANPVLPEPEALAAEIDCGRAVFLGSFVPNRSDLVACAVFKRHGETVVYDAAGSLRSPELGRIPLAHLLLWEGLGWAQRQGAMFMDFGGIPPAGLTSDVRAGIAAFKAGFGGKPVLVGGEWSWQPSETLSRLERITAGLLRR